MFCRNCGVRLDDGTKFCNQCGTNVEDNEGSKKMFCYNCGKELPENANFCHDCGVDVSFVRRHLNQPNIDTEKLKENANIAINKAGGFLNTALNFTKDKASQVATDFKNYQKSEEDKDIEEDDDEDFEEDDDIEENFGEINISV